MAIYDVWATISIHVSDVYADSADDAILEGIETGCYEVLDMSITSATCEDDEFEDE